MKKTLVSILCALLSVTSFAQTNWTSQTISSTENLNKVHFIDDQVGFILGDNGTLLKTQNGGTSWQSVSTGVSHNLKTIAFSDANTGYINGLKTSDGGQTWSVQSSSTNHTVIGAFSLANLFAGSSPSFSGEIYKSTDFGQTWTNQTDPIPTGYYTDVWGVNDMAYMTSWYAGHLVKTTDAGATWTDISQIDSLIDDAYAVCFNKNNINLGLVAGNQGKLVKTVDGANNWSSVYPSTASTTFVGYGIEIIDDNTYVVVGTDANPSNTKKIYETTNGGTSWTLIDATQNLNDVTSTSTKLFAVGENGLLLTKDKATLSTTEIGVINPNKISVYPNPANDYIYVKGDLDIKSISLYNTLGIKVMSQNLNNERIFVGDLPKGVYFLRFKNQRIDKKIIVK